MPKGIYERTIEIRNKNSMSNKGKISGFKGKHHSDEAKKKNSISHKGKKLPPFTEEHKRKIGISKLVNKNNLSSNLFYDLFFYGISNKELLDFSGCNSFYRNQCDEHHVIYHFVLFHIIYKYIGLFL